MTTLAVSNNGLWAISLGIGLVAALVVAFLLIVLVRSVDDIDRSVSSLPRSPERSPATRRTSQLSDRAVLGLIVEEAVVQDRYMNA